MYLDQKGQYCESTWLVWWKASRSSTVMCVTNSSVLSIVGLPGTAVCSKYVPRGVLVNGTTAQDSYPSWMAPRQIDTNKHHSLAKVHRTHPTVYPLSVILAAAVFSDSESEESSCKVVVGGGKGGGGQSIQTAAQQVTTQTYRASRTCFLEGAWLPRIDLLQCHHCPWDLYSANH